MAGLLLVGAEEIILVKDSEAYAASRPVMEGLELLNQLKSFPTTRIVIMTSLVDTRDAKNFVNLNGFPKADVIGILPEDELESPDRAQWHIIERQRAKGPINLVVTAHFDVYRRCLSTRQPVILYSRRGALLDTDPRMAWNEVTGRVAARREALARKERKEPYESA